MTLLDALARLIHTNVDEVSQLRADNARLQRLLEDANVQRFEAEERARFYMGLFLDTAKKVPQ